MKLQGTILLKGEGIILHYRNGKLLSKQEFSNTVTNMGIDQVAGLINGARTGTFTRLALGTSAVQAVVGDIALKAEIAAGSLARAAATATQITTDTTNDSAYLVHSWAATASYTVKEIGIVNSASGGRILARTTNFTAVSLVNGDSVTAYYKLDVD